MRPSESMHGERILKEIKLRTRKQNSAEEKICIGLDGLSSEESVTDLCRREGISIIGGGFSTQQRELCLKKVYKTSISNLKIVPQNVPRIVPQ